MRTRYLIALLPTLLATSALAQQASKDSALPVDERMKVLTYDESDVYTIRAKYGYQTNIVFGSGEEIETISVGDRSMWQIIPSGNRLFIRPMSSPAQTNMTVITDKHSYQFDLVALGPNDINDNSIYVARFVYPGERGYNDVKQPSFPVNAPPAPVGVIPGPGQADTAPAFIPPTPAAMTPAPTPVESQEPIKVHASEALRPVTATPNYNYTYSGPDGVAPLQAYDVGGSTYIKYRNDRPLPKVFVVEKGRERLANYYTKGEFLVVDTVASEFVLESGGAVVHVYNEMLSPR